MTLPVTSRNSRSFIRASAPAGRKHPAGGKTVAQQKPRPPQKTPSAPSAGRHPQHHPARGCYRTRLPAGQWVPTSPPRPPSWINNSKLERPAGSAARDGLTAIYNGAGSRAGTEPRHKGQQENSPRSKYLLQSSPMGAGMRFGQPVGTGSAAHAGSVGSAGTLGCMDAMPVPSCTSAPAQHRCRIPTAAWATTAQGQVVPATPKRTQWHTGNPGSPWQSHTG